MSIMQALKLVYMAHGWCLAVHGRPLIDHRIEAWSYGPVIPETYYSFRQQDVHDLQPFHMFERPIEDTISELLEAVYNMYKDLSAGQLSNLTHIKGGPWHRVYRRGLQFQTIPDELIAEHYKDKLARTQHA